ncbi:MAG: pilus assembly protein [Firmicutes bacterium]|nr:pilus assembly protein [Bacillota bacterium]
MRQSAVRCRRGQAAVELALVLPVLLLLLFATVEAGRLFAAHLTVVAASREGARWATLGCNDGEIEARVRQAAGPLDDPLLRVSVDPPWPRYTEGITVTVRVSYPVTVLMPVVNRILPDPVWVTGETRMRLG